MLHKPIRKAWHWTRRLDLSILVVLFMISALLLAFGELAEEVLEGETAQFDEVVLMMFRSDSDPADPVGPVQVEEVMRDITALGGLTVITMTTLAVIGFLLFAGRKQTAIIMLVATFGAFAVSTILKEATDRQRPDLVPHGVVVMTASFPSGHSMQSAATYLTMGALLAQVQRRRRMKAFVLSVATTVTLLVGVSRVYLGVHWPTDVLAGWAAGAGWALLCWLLARWLYENDYLSS